MTKTLPGTSLATLLQEGKTNRRELMRRAAVLGVSPALLAAMGGSIGGGVASAAGLQADAGGLLTVNNEQQSTWIRNFNPLLPENVSCRWPTLYGIYESLFVYNTIKAEIVPWLATEWSFNADNTELTFTTRENVLWSDGTPFTARDVALTFNLFLQNEAIPGNGARGVADKLDSVVADSDTSVRFTFTTPYTIGLFDIGSQMIVPEHIFGVFASQSATPGTPSASPVADATPVDAGTPVAAAPPGGDVLTFTNENPVGTGPFTEVARFETQIWELHKNPNYWQEGKPAIQGLRIPAYPNNDAANLATINGENDWAANFIPDIEKTFIARDPEHFHYWFPATGATVHLYLNTEIAPFDNADVRKAVSMAINRDQIVQVAMYDYTHPADSTGLSDAAESWKLEEAKTAEWVTMNPDRANELLDAAGLTRDGDVRALPDGTAMEYELNVVSGWSDWVQSCEIMAQNLSEIGIKATVKPYDQTTWQTRVQNGEFTMSIGWSAQGSTPFNFYRAVMSSATKLPIGESAGENWHRFASPEADELLDQFAATSDEAEQKEIVNQLQQIYADQAPAIPLFPGPQWGEFNTMRFEGFPSEENPYCLLSTYAAERGILLTTVTPVAG